MGNPEKVATADFKCIAQIICDAGGRLVGRTKLQKIGYLLEASGLGSGFEFEYRHYGPYSEGLATATKIARLKQLIDEAEGTTAWGGSYSIFSSKICLSPNVPNARTRLVSTAAEADSVLLELAATAAFLAAQGIADPWLETQKRKPSKATAERLNNAKALYRNIKAIKTPKELPNL